MKKHRKIILIIVSSILLLFMIGKITMDNIVSTAHETTVSTFDFSTLSDGHYNGEYTISPVHVEVEVIVQDHKLTDINILKHDNGFGRLAEAIINDIQDQQSLDVDVVSHATVSSKCILKAVEDALMKG